MALQIVILAAGAGTRMHSSIPKVMHKLAGKPLLQHVVQTAFELSPETSPIVVYGHHGSIVQTAFSNENIQWIEQAQQLGTGHAVMQALPLINEHDQVLILYGDVPLTSVSTLNALLQAGTSKSLNLLTAHLNNPKGYGRIQRNNQQQIVKIIEEKDATSEEQQITEINSGVYAVAAAYLRKWLPTLSNDNAQGEYYLTDIIGCAVQDKVEIASVHPQYPEEIMGVNDKIQLSNLERFYQHQQAVMLQRRGVNVNDPHRFDLRGTVNIGQDTNIDINVIIEGEVEIGHRCTIGANTILKNAKIGDDVEIKPNSIIEDSIIGNHCVIGPFARLRPGTVLANKVHIGNFVEVKKSTVDEASKINHLSYIGDAEIGKRVNVGAGTITCNYDGVNKNKTIIADDVFIGSDTQLVAPVSVGAHAVLAAGSTVVENVEPGALTLTHRLEQRIVRGWRRPQKKINLETKA